MPTPTYTPLANITLGSSAASVTFSSISQLYRDLVLVYNGNLSADAYFWLRFNGDTGSNYNLVTAVGDGSSTSSSADTNNGWLAVGLYVGSPSSKSIMRMNFMDYSATDKHKSSLIRYETITGGTSMMAGRWASTSAITSILIQAQTTTFVAGTTMALYGVAA